ncbi:DNA translocase FtsK 4TM domain-containing protein [Candidatus Mesenet endosymbiont of Phosphuga atrata]|uniref:DNA translocase FtsK 4TM domain-containing protein n=1 Tax=Candidatus Mesenet endosymbiont of Phosphuga atrata TaxID=3066221 RepID=UPI00397727DA
MRSKLLTYVRLVIPFAFATFLLLSILSYDNTDPSFNTATNKKVQNITGIFGSYVADIFIQFLGLGSITIPLAIILFILHTKKNKLYTILNISLFTLSLCAILSKLSLIVINRYRHGGIIGNMFVAYPYYALISVILISIVGIIGWQRVVKSTVFLYHHICKLKLMYEFYDNTTDKDTESKPIKIEAEPIKQLKNDFITDKLYVNELKFDDKFKFDSKQKSEFIFPDTDLLSKSERQISKKLDESEGKQTLSLLEQVLSDFGVQGQIINVRYGPVVTLYELEPQAGTKSSRVIGLAEDIARSMSALSARISIIPGRNAMGIELPNKNREIVLLRDLLETDEYKNSGLKLPIALGKSINGEPVIADLTKMPHLLVAGTTGSGKSVAINTMILSLVYRLSPDQCKMIMIDPKMLELSIYDAIPHLISPVVTEPKKAIVALKWVVKEMESRYKMMSYAGVRNIIGYNEKITEALSRGQKLEYNVQVGFHPDTSEPLFEKTPVRMEVFPYIIVIVDEMADLMLVAGKEIESSIQRLAQMARAAGIHIIMATQRPSVDVITGVIKANFPTRISFAVTSRIDSRTILGEQGAEQLLGMGDMLYMSGGSKIKRIHGPFVSDKEVQDIVDHLKSQGKPEYMDEITKDDESSSSVDEDDSESDELYRQAVSVVLEDKKASTSYIQRQLRIGYNRAANIIERMEKEGIISPPNHSGKRFLTKH